MIHCFERQGLGKAPYTFMGCISQKSGCQFCGTGILHQYWLCSSDGNNFYVGSDCILKSEDSGLINIVKREKSAKAKEKREEKRQSAAELRQAQWASQAELLKVTWLQDHLDCVSILEWAKSDNAIAKKLYDSFNQWGSLSDKQVEFLTNLYDKAQNHVIKSDCPTGKITIEGTIVGYKSTQTQFGLVLKMIVESNEGYRVFGTSPSSLNQATKGDKVRFNATVQPSNDDSYFGFFSRPTQGEII